METISALKAEHVDHHWHGPATVVNHHGSRVWISFGGTVLLCSPEQIRAASEEELAWEYVPDDLKQAFHDLHGPAPTYTDITQNGGPFDAVDNNPMQVDPEQDIGHAGTPEEPVATEERADAPEVPPDPPVPDPAMEQEPEPIPGESPSQTLARSLASDPQVIRNQRMDGMYKPIRSVRTPNSPTKSFTD